MTSLPLTDISAKLEARLADYVARLEQSPATQHFSASSLALIHAMACNFLQAGQQQRASNYFSLLLSYAPTNPDFLCARASCALQEGDPLLATKLLSVALYVRPESCSIALALAEALVSAGGPQLARQILLQVRRLAKTPEDAVARARAELLLQTLPSEPAPHAAA